MRRRFLEIPPQPPDAHLERLLARDARFVWTEKMRDLAVPVNTRGDEQFRPCFLQSKAVCCTVATLISGKIKIQVAENLSDSVVACNPLRETPCRLLWGRTESEDKPTCPARRHGGVRPRPARRGSSVWVRRRGAWDASSPSTSSFLSVPFPLPQPPPPAGMSWEEDWEAISFWIGPELCKQKGGSLPCQNARVFVG